MCFLFVEYMNDICDYWVSQKEKYIYTVGSIYVTHCIYQDNKCKGDYDYDNNKNRNQRGSN